MNVNAQDVDIYRQRGFERLGRFLYLVANGFDRLIGNDPRKLRAWEKLNPHAAKGFFAPLREGRVFIRAYMRKGYWKYDFRFRVLDLHIQHSNGVYYQSWISERIRAPKCWSEELKEKGLAGVHACPTGSIRREQVWSIRPCAGEVIPARIIPSALVQLASLTGEERRSMRRKADNPEDHSDFGYRYCDAPTPAQAILRSRIRDPIASLANYLVTSETVPLDWDAEENFLERYLGYDWARIRLGK